MRTVASLVIVFFSVWAEVQAQPSLTIIEPAPGQAWSEVTGLSGDGMAASGHSYTNVDVWPGFHWTRTGGRNDFGLVSGVPSLTAFPVISGDGRFVGGGTRNFGEPVRTLYRWSAATGYQNLGTMPGWSRNKAEAMNGDGSVIVGSVENGTGSNPPTSAAYRWTTAGFQDLGYLIPQSSFAQALARIIHRTEPHLARDCRNRARVSLWSFRRAPSPSPRVLGGVYAPGCHGITGSRPAPQARRGARGHAARAGSRT